MLAVDLHVHSNRSDGSFTPTQLVDYACEKGLAAFALTDHDTIDGLEEAERYADMLRRDRAGDAAGVEGQNAAPWAKRLINDSGAAVPEVIPGIEFSTEYQGHDIHVLGLYIDYHNSAFVQKLRDFVDSRTLRNRKMCRLLTEAGLPVAYEALLAEFPDAVITRAHYAKYMLNHGYVKSMSDAFDRYIGDHCPCFVPREKVTPVDAVQLILSAGGIPILAHPVLYHMSDENLDTLTVLLAEAGLVALEAIYSTYTAFDERKMRALARKYNLLVSGGSDFHGANKPGLDLGTGYGSLYVPYSVLRDIKEVIKKDSHL
nr:PHP domain-containing protein [uncultured Acetatifactor sp.]